MSVAAPVTESTLFLYTIITSTKCKIDFQAVGTTLGLKTGTASMRFQRLKARLDGAPAPQTASHNRGSIDENSLFLYQCLMVSQFKPDWSVIGNATNLKSGTAAMRWRRLQEKIAKDKGAAPGLQTPSVAGKSKTRTQSNVTFKKRGLAQVKEDAEPDGENDRKKVKTEDEPEPELEKRQTRGKNPNLSYMLDSSSSGAGTSLTGATSLYEDSAAEQADDESDSESFPEEKVQKSGPAKAATSPSFRKADVVKHKTSGPEISFDLKSASHSAYDNPKPIPNPAASHFYSEAPIPTSSTLVNSIEVDEPGATAAELSSLHDGHLVTGKRASNSTVTSANSVSAYDSAPEHMVSADDLDAMVQAPNDVDLSQLDDMASVAADDSISEVSSKKSKGMKRKNAATKPKNSLVGKLLNFFG